ncbi:hypothetical protein HK44_007550 [Pseudomonas fluorescens HK44]|uniref:Uncharacterized protein n=1 Tax=Pseudomonas fluorescens HK44 TaxID=1042209 RepID=A0A010SME1_PSEFL|nr:hypothetical protein HK44_007550 [Pseudomonas fluorescens HK44]
MIEPDPDQRHRVIIEAQHGIGAYGFGVVAYVVVLPNAFDAEEHQFVAALVAHNPVVAEVAAEQEGIAPATRLHQVITGTADKHVIALAAQQDVVASGIPEGVVAVAALDQVIAVTADDEGAALVGLGALPDVLQNMIQINDSTSIAKRP